MKTLDLGHKLTISGYLVEVSLDNCLTCPFYARCPNDPNFETDLCNKVLSKNHSLKLIKDLRPNRVKEQAECKNK